jgi:hypothetical protein
MIFWSTYKIRILQDFDCYDSFIKKNENTDTANEFNLNSNNKLSTSYICIATQAGKL